jgi:arylsulfatase A-like enzyme
MTVEWDRSRAIRKVRSPRTGLVEVAPDTARTGDHTPEGMLFVLYPGGRGGELDRIVDVIDLAPTITHLLGVSPDGFDGQPIREIVESLAPQPA